MENKFYTFKQLSRCPLITKSARVTFLLFFRRVFAQFFQYRKTHDQDMKTGKQHLIYQACSTYVS